ncbi:hypothetical protein BD770DRAFT_414418 [Pilaira anomala]|nr:hypothetical protein BD770DRAFT_414418 [Pilaira anomala]
MKGDKTNIGSSHSCQTLVEKNNSRNEKPDSTATTAAAAAASSPLFDKQKKVASSNDSIASLNGKENLKEANQNRYPNQERMPERPPQPRRGDSSESSSYWREGVIRPKSPPPYTRDSRSPIYIRRHPPYDSPSYRPADSRSPSPYYLRRDHRRDPSFDSLSPYMNSRSISPPPYRGRRRRRRSPSPPPFRRYGPSPSPPFGRYRSPSPGTSYQQYVPSYGRGFYRSPSPVYRYRPARRASPSPPPYQRTTTRPTNNHKRKKNSSTTWLIAKEEEEAPKNKNLILNTIDYTDYDHPSRSASQEKDLVSQYKQVIGIPKPCPHTTSKTNVVNKNPKKTSIATTNAVNKPSTTTTTQAASKPSTTFSTPDYVSIIRSTSSATIYPVAEVPPPPPPPVVQPTYHYTYPIYYPDNTNTATATIMPGSYPPQPYPAEQQAPYAIINEQTPYPIIAEQTPYLSTQQTSYPVIEQTFHISTEQPAVLPSMIEQPVPVPPMNEQPIQEQDITPRADEKNVVSRDLKEGKEKEEEKEEEEKRVDDTNDREIGSVKNSKVDNCIIVGENSAEKESVLPRQLNDKTIVSATTSTGTVTKTNDSNGSKKRVRLPRHWKVKMTNEGDIYYHNSLTGENCSSRPEI